MLVQLRNLIPVYARKERLDVRLFVSVVLVVICVLPQVDAQDGSALSGKDSVHEWVILVVRHYDAQHFLVIVHAQPDPARQLSRNCSLQHLVDQALEISKGLGDRLLELPQSESVRLTAPVGSGEHASPCCLSVTHISTWLKWPPMAILCSGSFMPADS